MDRNHIISTTHTHKQSNSWKYVLMLLVSSQGIAPPPRSCLRIYKKFRAQCAAYSWLFTIRPPRRPSDIPVSSSDNLFNHGNRLLFCTVVSALTSASAFQKIINVYLINPDNKRSYVLLLHSSLLCFASHPIIFTPIKDLSQLNSNILYVVCCVCP